jgi:hypothetical protein
MNGFENHPKYQFVQAIFNGSIGETITTAEQAEHVMKNLVLLGLEGVMSGGKRYLDWGCGSWLDTKIKETIVQCEKISKITFTDIVKTLWPDMDDNAKKSLLDSYLLLPIQKYKSSSTLDKEYNFGDFPTFWSNMQLAWQMKGKQKPLD